MSRRVTCPECGAAFRPTLHVLGTPVRCSNCQTVFTISECKLANEVEEPLRAVQTRGVPMAALVAAVAVALLLGIALTRGVAYFYARTQAATEVADVPRAHPDDAPSDSEGPKPPLRTEGHDLLYEPNGPVPQKQADLRPAQPADTARASDPQPQANLISTRLHDRQPGLALPNLTGWALLPDGVTLIVALPDEATLVYIDTISDKESKRVKLPFKPEYLAVQGKRLFASAHGASAVHVLDPDSGADRKEIKVPGGFVTAMACHADKGVVFLVMSEQHTIHALDPETGRTALAGFNGLVPLKFPAPHYMAIRARAQYLAVDPHHANTLYATYASGVDKWHEGIHEQTYGQGLEKYVVRGKVAHYPGDLPGQRTTISVPAGPFQPLERTGISPYAVPVTPDPGGFYPVRVSSDGKRVGVVGRAEIQTLEADNLNSGAGAAKCPSPSDVAFHPALDLMAVEGSNGSGKALYLFNGKSLTQVARIILNSEPSAKSPPAGRLLTFAARGTKLLYYDWLRGGYLRFFPLTLGGADLTALTKAYATEVRAFQAPGAIEGESLKILGKSSDFPINPQDMTPFLAGQWSGSRQLFAQAKQAGAWADLELPAPADGKYHVVVYLTESWDYGIVQFRVNGAKVGAPIDGFHADTVVSIGAIDLGKADLKKGANTLRVEVVGTNPKSASPHYSWGLDCVVLQQSK